MKTFEFGDSGVCAANFIERDSRHVRHARPLTLEIVGGCVAPRRNKKGESRLTRNSLYIRYSRALPIFFSREL
jgi:hypothetical protein